MRRFVFDIMARATLLAIVSAVASVRAGELYVSVTDLERTPVKDAVVALTRLDAERARASGNRATRPTAVIAQEDEQFVPLVTAMEVGTAASFPNRDGILHNVYSFSEAKKFQLPLYKDEPAKPVIFDRPGEVILGCNIHDWMVAYVYVLETPYFSKTDAGGKAILSELPEGDYEVEVLHPRKRKRGSTPVQRLHIGAGNTLRSEFQVALKPQWRPQKLQ